MMMLKGQSRWQDGHPGGWVSQSLGMGLRAGRRCCRNWSRQGGCSAVCLEHSFQQPHGNYWKDQDRQKTRSPLGGRDGPGKE